MSEIKAKGRMSKSERDYIAKNGADYTAQSIAEKLGREVGAVLKYMEKLGLSKNKKKNFEVQAEYEIKDRPYWPEIQAQFSGQELELFLYHWKQIVSQFRKDILATEEMQIIDIVKMEVLMNRALREQENMALDIRRMEREVEDLQAEDRFQMERQVVSLKGARESLGREYKDLLKIKRDLFKDIKGTRDQRIKTLDGHKKTFSALVNQLILDPDFYEECGREMEMMRLASIAEKDRLTDFHTYADGTLDQPILTADTVRA